MKDINRFYYLKNKIRYVTLSEEESKELSDLIRKLWYS